MALLTRSVTARGVILPLLIQALEDRKQNAIHTATLTRRSSTPGVGKKSDYLAPHANAVPVEFVIAGLNSSRSRSPIALGDRQQDGRIGNEKSPFRILACRIAQNLDSVASLPMSKTERSG
jgi:hypothetical protein